MNDPNLWVITSLFDDFLPIAVREGQCVGVLFNGFRLCIRAGFGVLDSLTVWLCAVPTLGGMDIIAFVSGWLFSMLYFYLSRLLN
jgi:hypothetical protein